MMARPREFEIDEAVEAAMNQFWERGYESTSMRQIVEATGLQKGSIYKAFDDKKSLFIAALKQYEAMGAHRAEQALSNAPSVLEGLRRFLQSATDPEGPFASKRGCLIINTIVEKPSLPPEIQEAIQGVCDRMETRIASVMRLGQEAKEIRSDRDAVFLAKQFLYGSLAAVEVAWKNGEPPEFLHQLIEATLQQLHA